MSVVRRICIGVVAVVWFGSHSGEARQTGAAAGAKGGPVKACSLLTREEVKKLVPWEPIFDRIPSKEEPIGDTGSSCRYPSVGIQVLTYSPATIDAARRQGTLEPVVGVGDEAFLRNNRDDFAELFARVGNRLLTVQKGIPPGKTFDTEKAAVVELGKALAAKLR